jgi:hypothetical protein
MPIPGPGTAISMTTIATEFGGSVPHSLSEYYRGGGLVPNSPTNAAIPTSGTISMGNFYGSANRVAVNLTISGNTYNYDVFSNRGPTYSPGSSDITVTVNPGVTVGSTSTGAYAMLVPSSFSPGDTVRIVNNGVIQGMGGAGGNGAPSGYGQNQAQMSGAPGAAGGHALYVNRPTVVTNNGTIAGGGGGGGGGASITVGPAKLLNYLRGGGGGGGGAGFNGGGFGTGGSLASPAGPGARAGNPGQAGTSPAGGAGGAAGADPAAGQYNGATPGGAGGGRGAAGTTAQNSPIAPAASGPGIGGGGGAAGRYITGNPLVTWPAFGTRQGGVS